MYLNKTTFSQMLGAEDYKIGDDVKQEIDPKTGKTYLVIPIKPRKEEDNLCPLVLQDFFEKQKIFKHRLYLNINQFDPKSTNYPN